MSQSRQSLRNAQDPWQSPHFYLRWLPRIIVVGLVLWLLIWATLGDSVRYFGFIHAGGFIFGLVALAVTLILAFRRDWIWMAGAAVLAVGILSYGTGMNIGAGEQAKAPGTIRVVSASLRGLNRNMKAAAVRLDSYDPDIIAVQEVFEQDELLEALKQTSGENWVMMGEGPLAVYTKGQITAFTGEPMVSVLKVNIALNAKTVSLWTMRAPKSYVQPAENAAFYASLHEVIRTEKPDILAGDFNATQWNAGYALIDKIMDNAQEVAGFGPGNTFPGPARRSGMLGSYARIDHIFVGGNVTVRNAFTGSASAGADHHPVVADIGMRR